MARPDTAPDACRYGAQAMGILCPTVEVVPVPVEDRVLEMARHGG